MSMVTTLPTISSDLTPGNESLPIPEAQVKNEFQFHREQQAVNTPSPDTISVLPRSSLSSSSQANKTVEKKTEINPDPHLIEQSSSPSTSSLKRKNTHDRKRFRGQNKTKDRPREHVKDVTTLCLSMALGQPCHFEECRFSHDIESYLATKGPDLPGPCPIFQAHGRCHFGLRCRFLSHHPPNQTPDPSPSMISNDSKSQILEFGLAKETQWKLRKKQYPFPRTQKYLASPPTKDSRDDRPKMDFRGKTYLAPLTTVGNLPFRRLCKDYGVDITCGEMAIATHLVSGKYSEWALTKRHVSETIFGVQIAGSKPEPLLQACELLSDHASFDFIDLNLGCPIDSVFQSGAGSALLDRPTKLRHLVHGIVSVIDHPVTMKIRTGVTLGKNTAHTLLPMFSELGVSMTTIHGRSRQQRYRSLSDWPYIETCASEKGPTMQVFGNGDVLQYQQYYTFLENAPDVDGIMIGRAALIKPWIFQEIKERRIIDVSSTTRMAMLGQFVKYGLEHWGTDTQGIELTRRFFLEFQSFHHRYLPIGLFDTPPLFNQRIPRWIGRNPLETLLGSPYVGDWIHLSEIFLGPTPAGFRFIPKHKASSDESKGSVGVDEIHPSN